MEMKEKMTLMSVSRTGQAQSGQGGAPGPKAVSSDGNDRKSYCSVGWCPGSGSKRQRKWKAGVRPIYRNKRGGL